MVDPKILFLILFAPLGAALFIVFFLLKQPKLAGWAAFLGILLSFAGSANLFWESLLNREVLPKQFALPWISASWVSIDFGFLIDPLSVLMLMVVTGVGSCIFLYSIGYMKDDPSFSRYFASLSLFAFSMIGIVVSNNFLMLFVFWELVAVSSYLLIGFWFEKPSAADAGNKAFIVNRVADFGFLIGIFAVWQLSGAGAARTFDFMKLAQVIPAGVEAGTLAHGAVLIAALLVFCGVAGKSAQFPLYIWLPDAMEGPTPVSALIHAATMVAAGVYLLARTFFLVSASHDALMIIAVFGGVTALLAATVAVVQDDIKKILAYSTISQLGYMVMAVGLGGPTTGMYHLTTHAFFKALLFLGAGSMIHGLHTQNIWEMGDLRKSMPITSYTFLIGTLALCGIWPLSGFFSKDEILALAFEHNRFLFGLGLFTAGLTAFYMARLIWVAVLGKSRAHGHSHAHESPIVMTLPLMILAVLSAAGGFIGIPAFLNPELAHHPHHPPVIVPILATGAAILGIVLGAVIYSRAQTQDPTKKIPSVIYNTLVRKYYLDHIFTALARVFDRMIAGLFLLFDLNVLIRWMVNGSAQAAGKAGSALRRLQTGRVQHYVMMFVVGVLLLIFYSRKHG